MRNVMSDNIICLIKQSTFYSIIFMFHCSCGNIEITNYIIEELELCLMTVTLF